MVVYESCFLELLQAGLALHHLRARLLELGRVHADLRLRRIALRQRRQVVAVGVVERLLADDAFLIHLQVPVQRGLVHGQVGRRGVHLVLLDVRLVRRHIGFGARQLRARCVHLCFDLLLIQLRQLLALAHSVVDVHVELFHNAGGLALHLDLGDGLDLARRHHGLRHIAASHLG